jgi:hypothetical protein
MTTERLRNRLGKIEAVTRRRPMVVYMRDGESELELAQRIAAVGYPVIVAPEPCATTDEWLAHFAPKEAS